MIVPDHEIFLMPGCQDIETVARVEFVQSLEEGRDPAEIEALRDQWEKSPKGSLELSQLYDSILKVPCHAGFPFQEPDDLPGIRALRQNPLSPLRSAELGPDLDDRMYGAWLGRCVGCALGKPVELFMFKGPNEKLSSRQRQKIYLTAISADEWPLRDYFPEHSPAEHESGSVVFPQSTREHIAYMETDDDIRYTVLAQIVLREKGSEFTTWDVAQGWMEYLGYAHVFTAEAHAYRNFILEEDQRGALVQGDLSDQDWLRIATHKNPYREWIGAQIRVDAYGYAAPGNPTLAAEFAYRDARLSHVKNGIYGAMFCAAMIASAFSAADPRAVVAAGLAEIPATSRLHAAIQEVISLCDGVTADRFEEVFDAIEKRFGHYDPVHTINNAAVCAAALLLSGGDFSLGVTLAVMGGWDTDCNGATVGSILGAMNGAKRLPSFWTARLNDTLKAGIVEYHPVAISECARYSTEIARKINPG